jgi:hypothetical protein
LAVDLDVHRKKDIGFPLAGCTSSSSLQEAGLFDLGLDIAATDCTLTIRRADPGLDLTGGLDHGVAAHPRRLGHCGLPTAAEADGYRAGNYSALHLVQMRKDRREESRELFPTGFH